MNKENCALKLVDEIFIWIFRLKNCHRSPTRCCIAE